jgi:hypothetical protein
VGQVRRGRLLRLDRGRQEKSGQEDQQNMHYWRQKAAQGSGLGQEPCGESFSD